jgi:hypothetical protein
MKDQAGDELCVLAVRRRGRIVSYGNGDSVGEENVLLTYGSANQAPVAEGRLCSGSIGRGQVTMSPQPERGSSLRCDGFAESRAAPWKAITLVSTRLAANWPCAIGRYPCA